MLNPLMTGIWLIVQTDDEASIYPDDKTEAVENDWFNFAEGRWNDVTAIYRVVYGQLYPQDLDYWANYIMADLRSAERHNASLRGAQ